MRALRKTHLKKNVAQVFWPHLEESDFLDHRLWKPLLRDIVLEKKETTPSRRPKQNRVDKMQSKA
jgi:hypothetical protein